MLSDKTGEAQSVIAEVTLSVEQTVGPQDKAAQTSQESAKVKLHLEVAAYICQMSAELSAMARNSEMSLLSYFLDMAAAEARAAEGNLRDKLQLGPGSDVPETILPQA